MPIVNPKPPSAWKDSGIVHLEEPAFAVKHEAVDEGTTVEPCLPPSALKDTSVLHLKEFSINHEVVDEEISVEPCLLPCGVRHLEDPTSAVKHEVADEGTSVDPCLLSSTWKDTGIYHLKESGFAVEPEVVDEPTTVEPSLLLSAWENNGIPHQEEPAFSIKHEVVDEWAGREPCFLTSAWDECGIPYLESLGYGDRHEMVDEGTSVEPCLPSSMWQDTGILHLNDTDFTIEHEVVDEGTTVEPPLLSSASKDNGILHPAEEPAFAIKHEVVTEWTSLEPCFMSSVWNDSGTLRHEDPAIAIKHEMVDEGTSVEPCLPPPPSTWKDTRILHPKEPTVAVEREVLDEDTSVEPCLLPNAWRDTNVLHLEESAFATKHEVADEGTSVEPCLPPSSWIDTGISHFKEPAFSITHEALDEGTSVEPCLLPSARKDTGILHLKEPAFVIKHEVVDEGTSVEPCLPPNNLSPLNLVRKDQSCRSRKRVSPVCDFPAGNGRGRRRKLTRLDYTQDNDLFQCETTSNIHVENLETDVNEITEEPPAGNTDKIQENVVSRKGGEALEGSFKAHKGARIKKATLFSKTDETKGLEKVSNDTNDKHGKRMRRVDVGSNNCNSSPNKSDARRIVRDTLRLFHGVLRKLVQAQEKKKMGRVDASLQISAALKIFKDHGKYINTKKMMGPVPGVEIGDLFNYRVELDIIGLHKPIQSGIDFIKQDDKIFAISVVASGRYDNDVVNCDVLIYTGQGGNVAGGCKQLEDQRLERGNLALKNSIDKKNLVRVIRGFKERKMTSGKRTTTPSYIYDGLYTVESYWHESGRHGMLIYKFELKRVPHQLELTRNIVKQSKKPKIRKHNCDNVSNGKEASVCGDISEGKETPIFVVNNVDDQKPPSFTYITEVIYPDWCRPIPPKGCDCKDGCLDSQHCACSLKNGGEIPYNHSGALVEEKSLVYECGPSCKCPPTCHNRVSQHGIKLPLEIFKTVSRGWGVRCLSSISSGSFVCEYIGELLDDKEAEQRIDGDDYLFDIGHNYNDSTLREGLSALIPHMPSSSSDVVENVGFTLDAGRYGNIGRFINHSCSPNLFAQNVLYDHEDKRIPHIMFYAAQNIPPLQELTYHYNYTKDQVFDSEGNIKRKRCYCGSSECTGRMY